MAQGIGAAGIMSINGALNQGGSMPYMNEGVSQEVSITIGALPARHFSRVRHSTRTSTGRAAAVARDSSAS